VNQSIPPFFGVISGVGPLDVNQQQNPGSRSDGVSSQAARNCRHGSLRMRHLPGVFFADVGWIDTDQRVRLDPFGTFSGNTLIEFRVQPFGLDVARQTLFGFLECDRFIQCACDLREPDILGRLYSEDRLMEELTDCTLKTGEDCPHQCVNPFSTFQNSLSSVQSGLPG
jgi:hypothetical protein